MNRGIIQCSSPQSFFSNSLLHNFPIVMSGLNLLTRLDIKNVLIIVSKEDHEPFQSCIELYRKYLPDLNIQFQVHSGLTQSQQMIEAGSSWKSEVCQTSVLLNSYTIYDRLSLQILITYLESLKNDESDFMLLDSNEKLVGPAFISARVMRLFRTRRFDHKTLLVEVLKSFGVDSHYEPSFPVPINSNLDYSNFLNPRI